MVAPAAANDAGQSQKTRAAARSVLHGVKTKLGQLGRLFNSQPSMPVLIIVALTEFFLVFTVVNLLLASHR